MVGALFRPFFCFRGGSGVIPKSFASNAASLPLRFGGGSCAAINKLSISMSKSGWLSAGGGMGATFADPNIPSCVGATISGSSGGASSSGTGGGAAPGMGITGGIGLFEAESGAAASNE